MYIFLGHGWLYYNSPLLLIIIINNEVIILLLQLLFNLVTDKVKPSLSNMTFHVANETHITHDKT